MWVVVGNEQRVCLDPATGKVLAFTSGERAQKWIDANGGAWVDYAVHSRLRPTETVTVKVR